MGATTKRGGFRKVLPTTIRREVLDVNDLQWPDGLSPCGIYPGVCSWLCRELLARTFREDRFTNSGRFTSWAGLNQQERCVLAADRWVRYRETFLRSVPRLLARAEGCRPWGFVTDRGADCDVHGCPFCWVHQIVDRFQLLRKAIRERTQPGARVWVAWESHYRTKLLARKVVDKIRPRPAAALSVRTWRPYDVCDLRVLAVGSGKGPRGCRYLHRKYDLAAVFARVLRYPTYWDTRLPSLGWVRASATPKNFGAFAVYGACREDWVPGKSMLDWAAEEPPGE